METLKINFDSWTAGGIGCKAGGKMFIIVEKNDDKYKVTGWDSETYNASGRGCGVFSEEEEYFNRVFSQITMREFTISSEIELDLNETELNGLIKIMLQNNKPLKNGFPKISDPQDALYYQDGVVINSEIIFQNLRYQGGWNERDRTNTKKAFPRGYESGSVRIHDKKWSLETNLGSKTDKILSYFDHILLDLNEGEITLTNLWVRK